MEERLQQAGIDLIQTPRSAVTPRSGTSESASRSALAQQQQTGPVTKFTTPRSTMTPQSPTHWQARSSDNLNGASKSVATAAQRQGNVEQLQQVEPERGGRVGMHVTSTRPRNSDALDHDTISSNDVSIPVDSRQTSMGSAPSTPRTPTSERLAGAGP
eukprot:2147345-Rhodomonas_salina.1